MFAYLYCERCRVAAYATLPGAEWPSHCPKCDRTEHVHALRHSAWVALAHGVPLFLLKGAS